MQVDAKASWDKRLAMRQDVFVELRNHIAASELPMEPGTVRRIRWDAFWAVYQNVLKYLGCRYDEAFDLTDTQIYSALSRIIKE